MTTSLKLGVVAAAMFVARTGFPAEGPLDRPAAAESELRLRLDRAAADWKAVRSWRIEYDALPASPEMNTLPAHRIAAAAAPGEFYHRGAHAPGYPWQTDPFGQEFFIHQGKACHQWPFNRTYSDVAIHPGATLPGTLPRDVLWLVIPVFPLTDYQLPRERNDRELLVPNALASESYHLRPGTESVNGEPCAILENGVADRIWISLSKGLCVMRRELHDPANGRLLQRISTEKTLEVSPHLWLPVDFTNERFPTEEGEGRVESKVHILRCDLNENVPESIFVVTHPAGSVKHEPDGSFVQVSAGGIDLLADIVEFLTRHGRLPTKPIRRNSAGWYLGGLLSGACAAVLLPRRRRPVSAPNESVPPRHVQLQ